MFKKVFPLASIMFIRFFGMFIVLPVLSVYALSMHGATPMLIGLAFAGYSLAQMLFVMPFGKLSDIIGRKSTIAIGLVVFAIGSLVCAYSDSIYMLIVGRILQGMGAISAVTSALVADIIKEESRTKAMAFVGIAIGLSTIISMILGPVIAAAYDLSMLFMITFFFVLIELAILYIFVPNPARVVYTFREKSSTRTLLRGPVLTMSLVNLFQKSLIIATFVIVPVMFVQNFGYSKAELINIYIPAFVVAFFAMGISSMLADAKGKYKLVLTVSLVLFALSYALLGFFDIHAVAFVAVILFFIGFNMLEPMMQSLIAKYAKAHERGKVMGLFNLFGFLGSALGGVVGGIAIIEGNLPIVVAVIVLATLALLVLSARMHNPARLKNIYMPQGSVDTTKLDALVEQKLLFEWYQNDTEKLLIIKYDSNDIDEESLRQKLA